MNIDRVNIEPFLEGIQEKNRKVRVNATFVLDSATIQNNTVVPFCIKELPEDPTLIQLVVADIFNQRNLNPSYKEAAKAAMSNWKPEGLKLRHVAQFLGNMVNEHNRALKDLQRKYDAEHESHRSETRVFNDIISGFQGQWEDAAEKLRSKMQDLRPWKLSINT